MRPRAPEDNSVRAPPAVPGQALKLARINKWLEATSLPEHLDVFRLTDFPTLIFATERMLDGVLFRQVEAR